MHMERKERERSLAQCLQMWRDRKKKKRKEMARSVAASWLNSYSLPTGEVHDEREWNQYGFRTWKCNDCKEHLVKNRYNYYMLKDDLWPKLKVETVNGNQFLCWNCMEKRFKSIFHRDLTREDFKEEANRGNPKVQELNRKRGVPDSKNIVIRVGIFKDLEEKKYHLQTSVEACDSMDNLAPNKVKTSTVLSELFDSAKKYMRDMKKTYPDSEIIVGGKYFLNELREFSRALERRL